MTHQSRGFTLIELAVALTIVALVIGGLAVPMSKRLVEQQYTDTQNNIDRAVEALVGFAALNRRLPCPDMNTNTVASDNRDGIEDVHTTTVSGTTFIDGCSIGIAGTASTAANYHSDPEEASWGDLPWQTLGLSAPSNADAWSNRLRYAVFTPLTTQVGKKVGSVNVCGGNFGLTNLGCTNTYQLDIRCGNPATTTSTTAALGCSSTTSPAYSVSTNAVFVVYSMGANAYGATSINNVSVTKAFPASNAPPDQTVNATERLTGVTATAANRRMFVMRARTDASSNTGEYDDLMSFMSSTTLAAKMLNAGVWP
ncbi:MAG: prepilin-type N-terminal cleavage/methylation domain-containing protein [Cytophagales bacterium]|nr:prepilin-type N-terminal cleavage/methylation domain-containing protein [Cytophagales bacterium]